MIRFKRIAILPFLLMSGALLFAADKKDENAGNYRSVQGTVSSAEGKPVNGAVVQLKNTRSLQIRSFITKQDGAYYFHRLSTDIDYQLKAEYNNSASPAKTLSSFDTRKQAVINLTLEPRK